MSAAFTFARGRRGRIVEKEESPLASAREAAVRVEALVTLARNALALVHICMRVYGDGSSDVLTYQHTTRRRLRE